MSPAAQPPSVAFARLYRSWGGAEVQLLHRARHAPACTDITVIAPRSTDVTLRALWRDVPHRWVDVDHDIDVDRIAVRRETAGRAARLRSRTGRTLTYRAGQALRRATGDLDAGSARLTLARPGRRRAEMAKE